MDKEARFDIYCQYCQHDDSYGFEEPCNECLNNPSVEDSHVPVNFKKLKPFINYILPDPNVDSYTRDRAKSETWIENPPTEKELKLYFEQRTDGDWYEKRPS